MRRPLVFGLFALWLSTGQFFLGPPLFRVEMGSAGAFHAAQQSSDEDEIVIVARDAVETSPAPSRPDAEISDLVGPGVVLERSPMVPGDESVSIARVGHFGTGRPSAFLGRVAGGGGRGGGGLGQGGGGGGGAGGRIGRLGRLNRGGLIVPDAAGPATYVFPLRCTVANADVAGWFASTRMTQTFSNPLDRPMEATYVFPLPTTAAVSDFEMRVGSRRVVGVIRRRAEAEKLYAEALARGRTASLLLQERVNVFAQKVGAIAPHSEVDVAVTYFHPLSYDHGEFEYVFPMTVGERYFSSGADPADAARVSPPHGVEAARGGREVAVHVVLDAGARLEEIGSPSHAVVVSREGGSRAVVDLARRDEIPDRDFVLRWRVAADSLRAGCVAHRAPDGTGYFSAFLVPPIEAELPERGPRDATFLLDASGSMAGAAFDTVRAFTRRCLERLAPSDRFDLIRFGGSIDAFAEASVPATRENVERAVRWLDECVVGGGTDMLPAVRRFADLPPAPGFQRLVGFVTDGFVGDEEQILSAIRAERGDARWFAFGVGSSVNRALVEGVAAEGRGVCDVVPAGDAAVATAGADRFFDRIETPLLGGLTVDANGLAVSDLGPARLPDLYAGSPIYVVGRYASPGEGDLLFRGTVGGREVAIPCHVVLPETAPAREELEPMWARERISDLASALRGADASAAEPLRAEIERTALEHRLASAWTSFVCVDEGSGVGGEAVKVAVASETPADGR